ncbi:PadR family transcriptional regulator [Streptacidiphilus jiangxiensis]|uniref:DNA-binding transcriptional regulator, PadR family n=1 Tax=Streptacidiphilus jiangxiensis TaxID=235985 RepID=A0A1H7NXU1_STRJI|nr:PadR family transcriptional regulator [Streptacidiphilus jiangxiensis]SEL28361.1 DNA-binding transcriptional regulator, PadR family [Streptacidiphilus jiangxiensis]
MSLRHAALGLLALRGEASGYDLLGIFNESLDHVWPATQSQLYTELGKLTDAELVRVVAEGGRGRKAYAVTEAGRKEFEHWLLEEPPTTNRRNDTLLRVFFLGLVPTEQGREFLLGRAAAAAEMHDRLRDVEGSLTDEQGPLAVHGRIALEWGLRYSTMQNEWARWAAQQLDAAESSDVPSAPPAP